jgi:predicted kinase
MTELFVVTGPAGVGKSTVSRIVASTFEPSAHLRMDDFLDAVAGGWVDPWLPDAAQQNDVVGRAAVAAAMQFLAGGYTVVLDGTVFPDAFEELAAACTELGTPLHYVVLRADRATCIERAEARDGVRPSEESFAPLHDRFESLGARERHVVDATGAPADVAARVVAALRAGALAA